LAKKQLSKFKKGWPILGSKEGLLEGLLLPKPFRKVFFKKGQKGG